MKESLVIAFRKAIEAYGPDNVRFNNRDNGILQVRVERSAAWQELWPIRHHIWEVKNESTREDIL